MIGNNLKTILITGINGFLGSHLAKALSVEYNIIGLEYSLENLYRIRDCNLNVYSVESGIPDNLFEDNKIDIIIHTATFYGRQNEAVEKIVQANLFIPFDLLDKAITNKTGIFINTDTVLERFVSAYALTKRHFQEWLYLRRSEIKVINLQLEHFYGPGCSNSNFITLMIEKLKSNEPVIDLTLGDQKRNFIYIDDVVKAYQTLLREHEQINDLYSSFQVCTNQLISIKEIVLILKSMTESSSLLNFGTIPYRENELMISETDNSGLLRLGWKPDFSIQEGLEMTIKSN